MKRKHIIFLALLLALIAAGLGMAFKKSGEQLLATTVPNQTQQLYLYGEEPPAYFVEEPITPPQQQTTIAPHQTQPSPTTPAGNGCYVSGCSGQICSDSPVVTTCEFHDAYSCYQSDITTCERQSNGNCGWTQTTALAQCMEDHPSMFN